MPSKLSVRLSDPAQRIDLDVIVGHPEQVP
jgi:hypothetical protein